ncbi:MAG: peptidoglycan-binding domain-containing protein [Candidatus Omnitrophota bacterium]|nr:peptidoglycan-binding domain-containing protein [Candidatus Omnitrophota bacterium]
MNKRFLVIALAAAVILPLAIFGCKGRVEKPQSPDTSAVMPEAAMPQANEATLVASPEPAETVATETIPPSAAASQAAQAPALWQAARQEKDNKDKDIQRALKNAGFYAGSVDGKIGPRTKKAIEEFQRSKGLKADGKVGPMTWAELEKYLVQQ